MQSYFSRIPNIIYNNYNCKDISRRVKLVEDGKTSPFVFYPYEIKNQLRSDQVAEYYYNDSELDWLIYISNGIVDPYFGWYVDNDKMQEILIQNYGSIETSLKLVKHYRNNWANDDTELTPTFYENTLPNSWKKYYEPRWASNFKIISYVRKQADSLMNTNRILEYSIVSQNANTFVLNELVDILKQNTEQIVGVGQVSFANSTVLRIQSVFGDTSANSINIKTLTGETSKSSITSNSVFTVHENITLDEQKFWSPVYAYEYENEINEQKKNIRLVGDNVVSLVVNEFTKKLRS